ncbi:MAG TPA: GatB/YqeY domain-containing protein [Candidatus Omnitrophota bacterium]|nr:GatB/YqeY domain-containing protein [Candidatus Omnitrophota bacterium]
MLQDKIDSDLKEAMRARDEIRLSTLRLLKSAIGYSAIAQHKDRLEDGEVFKVIQKEIKKRQEAIENYVKGNRPELAEKEKKELLILENYLPAQISDEELLAVVKNITKKMNATSKAQMGAVMKEVVAEVQGRADGKKISAMVSRFLS